MPTCWWAPAAVERLIYGGGSLDRFGRLASVNRGIEDGTLEADEYSSLSVAFRYLAGSLGLPFMPIRSLRGSDLMKTARGKIPRSDVADVDRSVHRRKPGRCCARSTRMWLSCRCRSADEEGNAWIMGPRWDNVGTGQEPAKRTILITENIVSSKTIRQNPERTVIPGFVGFTCGGAAFWCAPHLGLPRI